MSQESESGAAELLQILEAQVESLRGHPDAALERLQGRTDPASIRRRLGIHIEAGKPELGAEEIRGLEISESWADLAALVFGGSGDLVKAKAVVAWAEAHGDFALTCRTCVFVVDGSMRWIFRDRPEDSSIVPGSISAEERQILVEVASTIEPSCKAIVAKNKVETEVESQLLQRYFDISYLLANRSKVAELFNMLLSRHPIPIKVGQAVVQGLGKGTTEIANRLWEEHPDSFPARLLSCVIVARDLKDLSTADERALSLTIKATTNREREDLCELMYELSELGHRGFDQVEKIANDLLGPDAFLLALFRADQLVRAGKHKEALILLEERRDESDPRWLRGYARAKEKAGDSLEALQSLKRLGAIVPSPDVFGAIVRLSEKQGQFDDQKEALEQTLALDPGNPAARWQLAMLFVRGKEYLKAASHFEILKMIQPEDEAVLANLAVSYSLAGEAEKALAAITPKTGQDILPLALLKTRAQILESIGRVDDGFIELAKGKTLYWEDPEYLIGYVKLGFASGKEKEANVALTKLQELRDKGVIDDKVMRPVSLDEMRRFIEEGAKRRDEIRRLILMGKVPWITAAQMQREVPLWSWLLKTQPLEWVWDEPLNRATYTIYSTNSYRAFQQGDVGATLEEISAPDRGTPIVVDLSALVTLHEIGLFATVADYFGVLHVPVVYLSKVVDDASHLLPHQITQKQVANEIVAAVREGKLTVLNTAVDSQPAFPRIDEYSDDGGKSDPIYRLRDFLGALHEAGLVDDAGLKAATVAAHKPGLMNDRKLAVGERILIEGLTLETLHGLGLLGTTMREFSVHVTKEDYDDTIARVRTFEALEKARTKYNALWATLKSDNRVHFTPVKRDLSEKAGGRDSLNMALAGMFLAKERNLPLLCDDRVVQAVTLNEHKEDRTAAFGTDSMVIKLFEDGELKALDAAHLLLRLMEWRYRFLLMPPELMKALADQHRTHPPGHALRQVAKYIHDCMRDPGLFAGLESTTPPTSVAVRLYQTWAQNISETIMDLWAAPDISEEYAEEFTRWALTEFLPSPPRVLDERLQAKISALTPLTAFTRALIRGSGSTQFARINRGLRTIADGLGINEKEYVSFVTKVVRGPTE